MPGPRAALAPALGCVFRDPELSEYCFGETKRAFGFGHESVASAGTAKSLHVAQPARPHDDTQVRQMRQPLGKSKIRHCVRDRAEDDARRRPDPSLYHARVGAVPVLRFGALALREANEIDVRLNHGVGDLCTRANGGHGAPDAPITMMMIAGCWQKDRLFDRGCVKCALMGFENRAASAAITIDSRVAPIIVAYSCVSRRFARKLLLASTMLNSPNGRSAIPRASAVPVGCRVNRLKPYHETNRVRANTIPIVEDRRPIEEDGPNVNERADRNEEQHYEELAKRRNDRLHHSTAGGFGRYCTGYKRAEFKGKPGDVTNPGRNQGDGGAKRDQRVGGSAA